MYRPKISALLLLFFIPFSSCSSSPDKQVGGHQKGPTSMIYSPNAEPLNGGPLGTPTCKEALSHWFDRLDTNHTNAVSREAFLADAQNQFRRMDLDNNGYLLSEELERFRLPYRQQASAESYSAERSDQHKHKSEMSRSDLPDPVMSADTNNDFRVTLDEFMGQASSKFSALDTDHNGAINHDEALQQCTPAEK